MLSQATPKLLWVSVFFNLIRFVHNICDSLPPYGNVWVHCMRGARALLRVCVCMDLHMCTIHTYQHAHAHVLVWLCPRTYMYTIHTCMTAPRAYWCDMCMRVAKEGSTSGIRTQHPCLSGTVPYRLGYWGSHTLMGPSCYTAPPPQQAVSSRRTYSQGVRWVVGSNPSRGSFFCNIGANMRAGISTHAHECVHAWGWVRTRA